MPGCKDGTLNPRALPSASQLEIFYRPAGRVLSNQRTKLVPSVNVVTSVSVVDICTKGYTYCELGAPRPAAHEEGINIGTDARFFYKGLLIIL